MNSLSILEFDEWVNIPRPLIQALMLFKECFMEQSRKISDCYNEIENSNSKVNLKLRNLNESLANTNDAIRVQQDVIMKKVKERCDFLSSDFAQFKKKVVEENNNKQKILNENSYEMKEQVNRCIKAVSNIVDIEEINKILNEKSIMIHQNVLNSVRDQQLRPSIDKLMTELKTNFDKLSRSIEVTNNLIKSNDSHNQEELQKLNLNLSELRMHTIQRDGQITTSLDKINEEINTLNKQFDFLHQNSIETDKNLSTNIYNHNNEINQIKENYFLISSKIETIERNQLNRSRTVIPTSYPKQQIKEEPHINDSNNIVTEAQEVFNRNALLMENELKSYRFKMELEMKFMKNELLKTIKDHIQPLEAKMTKAQNSLESANAELKDKLSWFPINVSEISGMSPYDARLFTIEARLRAEENSRIQALNNVEKSLETIRKTSLSPIIYKSPERRATPDIKTSFDGLKTVSEIEEIRPNGVMEGIVYDSFDGKRGKRNIHKSSDFNKDLHTLTLRKIVRRKSFKK
ncbi:hypothetical protein SteCoe_26463 [Stentor coeruleus]|uniref:Uncharacterized protein n=1 Tax=Stentor coeruleus TaxID=5963 RepID=A0A1R2BCT3_9CILI|nr:hypothetical protein SteCoe_26463 [Stentor coeruleus]